MSEKRVSAGVVALELGLSPGRIRQLAQAGVIPSTRTGGGHRRFDLAEVRSAMSGRDHLLADLALPLSDLQEDVVWRGITDRLPAQSDVARSIEAYAFTEMLNNAIDHSGGTSARVRMWIDGNHLTFQITDDGVGVFAQVRETFDLPDTFAAIAELTKGKRTSAADAHSGEGIFFTSKAVDLFQLESDGLRWKVDNVIHDHAVGESEVTTGTRVSFGVATDASRPLGDVFSAFSTDHEFTRSQPVIKLFELGTEFVSRSEAKRLLVGMESFTEITLDFDGVSLVGQGFVDEVFRVWGGRHPATTLNPVHMNDAVRFMVERGLPR